MELTLGYAPASGGDAVTQCNFFKTLLRNRIGRDPAGAYLRTVSGDGRRGLVVDYEPGVPGALAWAKEAEKYAEMMWEEVAHGRGPITEIKLRRKLPVETEEGDYVQGPAVHEPQRAQPAVEDRLRQLNGTGLGVHRKGGREPR